MEGIFETKSKTLKTFYMKFHTFHFLNENICTASVMIKCWMEDFVRNFTQFQISHKGTRGKDQEKAQSAKDSRSKNPRWEKSKLTIRHPHHENIS